MSSPSSIALIRKGSKIGSTLKPKRESNLNIKQLALTVVPLILLIIHPGYAIFNCLAPNMFKMGKVGQPSMYLGGAERTSWYPQQQQQQQQHYYAQSNHMQNPLKLLFQPKWKTGGGGLFGNRGWNNWRSNGNFYRPGYGYAGYSNTVPAPNGGYPLNEQLNVAPFSVPAAVSSYSHVNDGWSAPLINSYNNQQQSKPIQQSQVNSYDSFSQTPIAVVEPPSSKPIVQPPADTYTTKGGSGSKNKQTPTKNANVLLADGGYNSFDAHLLQASFRNRTYGYSYPEWYSNQGVADSPAKIAQQLMKFGGFKRQRLQEQQKQQLYNQTTALLAAQQAARLTATANGNSAKFTILDEPRFVGFGTVQLDSGREARLSCSFGEAIDQTNRSLWIKFLGPYNTTQVMNNGIAKVVPPFNCANSQCRTLEVESVKDFRYRFDHGPATSTLIISEPQLQDYGIYRCSALTKAINDNPLETLYQIVRFGSL